MKVTRIALALALAAALGTARPALAANKEHQQLMADIRMLQEQAQQLQNMLAALNEAIKAVNTTLNARIAEQTEASTKSFADQKLILDSLSNDLRVVRERVDDNNVRLGSLSQEVDALRQTITQMGGQPSVPGLDNQTDGSAPAAAPTGAMAVGASPQKLWDGAQADYWAGQYDLAVLGYEAYIKSFPKSDQADDAQVAIGNCYLQDGKNDKAIQAYELAIRNYPGGNALPEANFKRGVALLNLKRPDDARAAFESAIKNFPDSDAARLAETKLQELKKR